MGTRGSLITNKEVKRLNKFFNTNAQTKYNEALNAMAAEADEDDRMSTFSEFIESEFPEFSGLFQEAYDAEMKVFIRGVLSMNRASIVIPAGIPEPSAALYEAGVIEVVEEHEKMLIPPKGTRRKWEDEEVEFVQKAILGGFSWQEVYYDYLANRLCELKIGRTKSSFSTKFRRQKKKLAVS